MICADDEFAAVIAARSGCGRIVTFEHHRGPGAPMPTVAMHHGIRLGVGQPRSGALGKTHIGG